MKKKIHYVLIFLLILAACSRDNASLSSNTLTGKWTLVKYHNLTNGTSESEPADIPRSITMVFTDNGTQGTIDGLTVTNSVSGAYELFQNNKMKTLGFGGTKIGEPHWGNKFWDAIHAASSFERQNNKLYIYFNTDKEKMEFMKK